MKSAAILKVARRRNQLYGFLLLAFAALQPSCGIKTPPPGPAMEPPEVTQAELTRNENTPARDPEELPAISAEAIRNEILPESVLARPEKEHASPGVHYNTVLLTRAFETLADSPWRYRLNGQSQVVGFEFSNRGGNRILPKRYDIEKNLLFTRDFQFNFDDRARQDIHVSISDWAPSRDGQFKLSELMNSVMYLFPRNYLAAIKRRGEQLIVTLPTGEEVEFDSKTHEIRGGVFAEEPVDLSPDKHARKFPRIDYLGKGVIVRANSYGTDPRLATLATITARSPASDRDNGSSTYQCQVPSRELWEQSGAVRFKFSNDTEFEQYLLGRCGFGLPKSH